MSSAGDRADGELEDSPQPTAHNNQGVTRREAMRRGAGAAAAAGVLATGAASTAPTAAADEDDLFVPGIGPDVAGPGLGIGATVASWLSGGDGSSTSEDLYRSNAEQDLQRYRNAVEREFALTESFLDYLLDGIFEDAKLDAIDLLNDGESESDVEQAALNKAKSELARLEQNWLNAFEAGIATMSNLTEQARDADLDTQFENNNSRSGNSHADDLYWNGETESWDYDLLDGSQHTIQLYEWSNLNDGTQYLVPYEEHYDKPTDAITPDDRDFPWYTDGNDRYLQAFPWRQGDEDDDDVDGGWEDDGNTVDDVEYYGEFAEQGFLDFPGDLFDRWENDLKPDIQTWVSEAYTEVASGEIEPDELLSASNLANTIADEEPANRAIGSLLSLGLGVEPEHPAEISTQVAGQYDATISGGILASMDTSASVDEGDSVNPANYDDPWVVNYDLEQVEVEFPQYDDTLDGGVLTLTSEPPVEFTDWLGEYEFVVETNQDETVAFAPSELDDDLEVDLSSDLEETIAEVDSLMARSTVEGNANQFLDSTFDVDDVEGTDSLDFEHDREVHTTENYMTQDEWEARNEELEEINDRIDDLEGGGIDIGVPSFGGWDELEDSPLGLGILAIAVLAVIGIVTDLLPGLGD